MIVLRDRQHRPAVIMAAVVIIGIIAIHIPALYDRVGEPAVTAIYNLGSVLLAAMGTVLSILLAYSYKPREVLRRIWLLLGAGLLLWTIGEIVYARYVLVLHQDPWPSEADIFYIAGYLPLFIGLILRFRSLGTIPERERVLPIVLIFVVLVALVGYFIFYPIVIDTELSSSERMISVLYPLGDLLLALGAVMILLVLTGGTLSRPWIYIVAGFCINALSDLGYTYFEWQEMSTTVADVIYIISYVVIVFGIYLQARLQKIL
jgi:hypothetical protein